MSKRKKPLVLECDVFSWDCEAYPFDLGERCGSSLSAARVRAAVTGMPVLWGSGYATTWFCPVVDLEEVSHE